MKNNFFPLQLLRLWVFFALGFFLCSAQETKRESVFLKPFYGNGTGKIKGTESNFVEGLEVGISENLNSEEAEWIRRLNAKRISFTLVYTDMDGIQRGYKYGKNYAIATQMDIGIAEGKSLGLYFTPEMGLAYVTKTVMTNPETFIFGSHINFFFAASLSGEVKFPDGWRLAPQIRIIHYSNGSIQLPNAGMNAIVYGLTIRKELNLSEDRLLFFKDAASEKPNGVELLAGLGWRGKYKIRDKFFRTNFYAGYSRFFNQVFALRSGVDVVYYDRVYNPDEYDDSIPYWGKSYEHFRVGVSVGGEVKMGKLALNANVGRYVYMKSPYNQKTYWNAAFRYYILPKFGIQTTLYAHKVQADFISLGIFARL